VKVYSYLICFAKERFLACNHITGIAFFTQFNTWALASGFTG